MKNIERASRFFDAAKEIRETSASDAASIAYVARVFAQVTLPHSKQEASFFERRNGGVVLSMRANPNVGLPFGTYPRLILSWVVTEAIRNKTPELELGTSLAGFMAELDLIPRGGRWGTSTRLREQMNRLLETTISWTTYETESSKVFRSVVPFSEARFWWDAKRPAQADLWKSTVRLSHEFYEAIRQRPVAIDMRALKLLAREGRSPLALDIYTWVTYRMSYLQEPTTIPWASLAGQFGGEYGRTRDFKAKFLARLKEVHELYPAARVSPTLNGLLLEPSPTHVPRLRRKGTFPIPSEPL